MKNGKQKKTSNLGHPFLPHISLMVNAGILVRNSWGILSPSLLLMLENEVGKFKKIKSPLLFSHPTRLSRRNIPVIPTGEGQIVGHLTKFTSLRLRVKEKYEE